VCLSVHNVFYNFAGLQAPRCINESRLDILSYHLEHTPATATLTVIINQWRISGFWNKGAKGVRVEAP